MSINFSDLETTYVILGDRGKTKSPLHYHPENRIVSLGWALDRGDVSYRFLHHTDSARLDDGARVKAEYQDALARTTLFVAHNAKFDLGWNYSVGFDYSGPIWCTQIAEYVLARGRKLPLSLKDCCDRHGTEHKKLDIVEDYFDRNVPTQEIPADILEEYGRGDILSLRDLYFSQRALLEQPENAGLLPTIQMMNEFCLVLIEMEKNGIAIDQDALARIREEYVKEKVSLEEKLFNLAKAAMGDRPYNLNSPEQLSQILYSRKVLNKEIWAETFNLGSEVRGAVRKSKYKTRMTTEEFKNAVRAQTKFVYKEIAQQCHQCEGLRHVFQVLNGKTTKRKVRCPKCSATGIDYIPTERVAGFKLSPSGPGDVTALGFATDSETVEGLAENSSGTAGEFIAAISRLNQVDTYISTFVDGILSHVLFNGLLHPGLNQCITATGRLSSSNPNFQNLPRGSTFPVKRSIVSRFPGGCILEADYAGAEYRAAVFLSQDKVGLDDLRNKRDPHTFTRVKLQEGGELVGMPDKAARQEAKTHTFKPLYGGTSGTAAQRKYYRAFLDKHAGISRWQDDLQTEAINTKKIVLPSGREYAFPDAERTSWGGSTFSTQIKNYPVQGFATGDIVPIGCILVRQEMIKRGLRSLIILEVHDSIILDVYPGELDACIDCCRIGLLGVIDDMVIRYGVYFNVPLGIELKVGPNWLDAKEIAVFEHPGIERPG